MITVSGVNYEVHKLRAGDLPALSALVERAGPLLAELEPGRVPDFTKLLPVASELVNLIAHLLDCPRADLEALPLHEFIGLVQQLAGEWMALNAGYLDEQVTPALNELATAITAAVAPQGSDTEAAKPTQT